ncbi:MAG: hypothetical protein GY832_32165 [Chloroflexi bacterium]|nr:hypothetical protein [Chloroflexota bacterium]
MTKTDNILEKLKGGDHRSIGMANEVVEAILSEPSLFGLVFGGMLSEDSLIRMRSADVVEKVTAKQPEYLEPYREELIGRVAMIEQQEVRWHVAQVIPRLKWSAEEIVEIVEILRGYLQDESKIVKTSTMQALADLVIQEGSLFVEVERLLEEHTRAGSPAMRSLAITQNFCSDSVI